MASRTVAVLTVRPEPSTMIKASPERSAPKMLITSRAIDVNIQNIRLFTRIRKTFVTHKDLLLELEKLRNTSKTHAGKIAVIFKYPRAPRSASFRRRSISLGLIVALALVRPFFVATRSDTSFQYPLLVAPRLAER